MCKIRKETCTKFLKSKTSNCLPLPNSTNPKQKDQLPLLICSLPCPKSPYCLPQILSQRFSLSSFAYSINPTPLLSSVWSLTTSCTPPAPPGRVVCKPGSSCLLTDTTGISRSLQPANLLIHKPCSLRIQLKTVTPVAFSSSESL